MFLTLRLEPKPEDDLDDADYEEGEAMEEKYNQVQNDWDDLVENEMYSAFNNLGEKVSDPGRRRSRYNFARRRRRHRPRRCVRKPHRCRKGDTSLHGGTFG